MPRFYPNAQFSDCWSSIGKVTYYHRNGICYFRSKPYSQFAGTAEQLEQQALYQRAIKAWQQLPHKEQLQWRRLAKGVAAHRPPYGDGNSISGYNLFVSAYHGFSQLGNEHIPSPKRFVPFPIFSFDFLGATPTNLFDIQLSFKLTLCGTSDSSRYRVLGKIQIEEPGIGRNPGKMRNYLSPSIPAGEVSTIEFTLPNPFPTLSAIQIHIRYLLLDTKTGYRSNHHTLSAIQSILTH